MRNNLQRVLFALSILHGIACVFSTSAKMDFLPFAHVRTDPIISQTCLSDHVHTFFGAAIVRPDLTYEDLRNTTQNSGNVEENKSLYWYPTVYRYEKATNTYTRDPIYFTSTYYIWETGRTTAFPNDFRMIAGMRDSDKIQANAECVEESPCERQDCSTDNTFFPATACAELEVSMSFPSCWDGVNRDSDDHYSHVAYTDDGGVEGECPEAFPVRIPQIQLFFRIINYDGGHHTFSDGSSRFHADYISGWDDEFLQTVLDECENESFAAMPDAFCEDFLTFRDAPKGFDDDSEDADIVAALQNLQPNPPVDTSTITDEATDNIGQLPRGGCDSGSDIQNEDSNEEGAQNTNGNSDADENGDGSEDNSSEAQDDDSNDNNVEDNNEPSDNQWGWFTFWTGFN